MAGILRMPEVAAGAAEAVLGEWQVALGAPFVKGEVLATVETDKAVVEIEAEHEGALLRTLVTPGAAVEVGAPIAVVGTPGEDPAEIERLLAGEADPAPGATRRHGPKGKIFISPLARRIARDAGLAIERVPGTGPNGRIMRRDVEAAITAAPAAERFRGDAAAQPVQRSGTPHSRMRRAIAARLTESKQTVPHIYLRGTARVGRLLALRRELNEDADTRISVNDLIVKAVAQTHRAVPAMNVIWTPDEVESFDSVDVAVAIAAADGLVTPVLRGVEAMTISQVAARTGELAKAAGAGRIRQADLEGGTITVTNLGMYGTEEFAAIINPPHSAILAVGAAREEPVVEDGALAVGTVLRVTLAVDHRPVDGVVAAEWMRAFLALIEHPLRILR